MSVCMRVLLGLLIISMPGCVFAAEEAPTFDAAAAERFRETGARMRRKGISEQDQSRFEQRRGRGAAEQAHARVLRCYDWHSSVHGHWLLVRLVRTFPNASFTEERAMRFGEA